MIARPPYTKMITPSSARRGLVGALGALRRLDPAGAAPLGSRFAGARSGRRPASGETETQGTRKGTNGVSTNGVTAIFSFLTGTFWVLPLTYFTLPKSARAYLFPQSVEIHYFCSGPTGQLGGRRRRGRRGRSTSEITFDGANDKQPSSVSIA